MKRAKLAKKRGFDGSFLTESDEKKQEKAEKTSFRSRESIL